jgi:hypothetical protein
VSSSKATQEERNDDKWISRAQKFKISRRLLDQVVMDYLVREGFKEAALNLASEANVTPPPYDTTLMDQQTAIRNAVEKGDIPQAMEMVNDLEPEILDSNPKLHFHLQQQRLLEYIKEGRIDQALEFAQTELSICGEEKPEILEELEKTMTLLALDRNAQVPFSEMLKPSQRSKVASELNAAIVDRQNTTVPDRLTTLMKLVMWAQDVLEKKNIKAPKIKDITTGQIEL